MAAISARSFDAEIRRQVFLERLKASEVKAIDPFLVELDRKLRDQLSRAELTGFGKARLLAQLDRIAEITRDVLTRYRGEVTPQLRAIGQAEAKFQANSLTAAVSNPLFEAAVPTAGQVSAAIFAAPMSVRGAQGGKLLQPFIKDWSEAQVNAVVGVIRQGAFEGQTNAQMVRAIRGTAANRFADGVLATTKRTAETVVRTAIQHVSSVASVETMAANADLVKRYRWVSTLDDRTSDICQSLDGTEWPVGEGPLPPILPNCRSRIVPVLDERFAFLREGATRSAEFGPVPANQTFYSWLKDQPKDFQDNAIGPVRAKLLRDGGLSAERFRAARLSKDFKPLTLAEMQRLEPLAFERAGITLNPDTGLPIGKP